MTHWNLELAAPESQIEAAKSGIPTISVDERATRRWFFHVVDWPDGGKAYAGHSLVECLAQIVRRGYLACHMVSPEYTDQVFRLELVGPAERMKGL